MNDLLAVMWKEWRELAAQNDFGKAATIAMAPSVCSWSAKLRLTGASHPNQFAAKMTAIAATSRPIMRACFSTASSAIK